MFMQAGFAMVETGFTRAKNVAHTMGMNFLVYGIGVIGFWICGFALMFGGVGGVATLGGTPGLTNEATITLFGKTFGLFGFTGFFLNNSVYDVGIYALFLFQMVFMDTTATIPTGAMAERWRFASFVVYGFFISMFVYPIFGNWVWGGGWLSALGTNFSLGHGHVDFAGSSVVHMVGGIAAFAGAIVLGPRHGKYNKDGSSNAIPGHNIPMAIVGTFILAFGWFGFNPGSSLAGNDLRISVVATNTMLASASGALVATLYMWLRFGKPDPSMMANGLLAGLVAITAPCAFVNGPLAVLIGAVAGFLVVVAVFFIDQKLHVDDPVGAVAVHGVNGLWGILALGLFADGSYGDGWNGVPGTVRGLLYGDPGQFVAELIGAASCIVFVFTAMYLFFKVSNKLVPLRVTQKDEFEGLDLPEMGIKGYEDLTAPGRD
jgi:Amt family ammonium transporter